MPEPATMTTCPHCGLPFPLLADGKVVPHVQQIRQGRYRPRKTVACPPKGKR